VEVQPDGKIVVIGQNTTTAGPGDSNFVQAMHLMRFNPDWSLDATFGDGGRASLLLEPQEPVWETRSLGFDLAFQPDGKIIAAGASQDRFAVARLNPDGKLDGTFGAGGLTVTPISAGDFTLAVARKLALTLDGKVVAAGDIRTPGGPDGPSRRRIALARYVALRSPADLANVVWLPVMVGER
jgi:uncharacterized delta-60 repeat protein